MRKPTSISRSCWRALISIFVLGHLALFWSGKAASAHPAAADPADHRVANPCSVAIARAARDSGVPEQLLEAIALVESGRGGQPWPWAVNVAGRGFWHGSRAELATHLERHDLPRTGVDIGCFQINSFWHGDAFADLQAMADPQANADYAAAFLVRLKREFGSWEAAAGAYHSRTPELAAAYRDRVLAHLSHWPPDTETTLTTAAATSATDMPMQGAMPLRIAVVYPLLRPGTSAGYGSLVPIQQERQSFLTLDPAR